MDAVRFWNLKTDYEGKQRKADQPNATEADTAAARAACRRFKLKCERVRDEFSQLPHDQRLRLQRGHDLALTYLPTLDERCADDRGDQRA
jgi:hypothetical protein